MKPRPTRRRRKTKNENHEKPSAAKPQPKKIPHRKINCKGRKKRKKELGMSRAKHVLSPFD